MLLTADRDRSISSKTDQHPLRGEKWM